MIVEKALQKGIDILKRSEIDEPISMCRRLLADVLNQEKEYLIIHMKDELDEFIVEEYFDKINKLAQGIPLQYITNKQEFMGLNFFVNENVLIPQPDTEVLVEEVISITKEFESPIILDMCTGSGAIAISIAHYVKNVKVCATDISQEAILVAKKNAIQNKVNVNFEISDMFEQLDKERYSIIVSNPPYIETDTILNLTKQVQKEPHIALDGGTDGLDFYRILVEQAYKFLKPKGYLCMEIGYNQKEMVEELLKNSNQYENIQTKQDLSGNNRVVIAQIRGE